MQLMQDCSKSFSQTRNVILLLFSFVFCFAYGISVYQDKSPFYDLSKSLIASLNEEPVLNKDSFKKITSDLIANGANSASIFSINLGRATRTLEYCQIGTEVCTSNIGDADFLYKRIDKSYTDEMLIDASVYNDGIYVLQSGGFICAKHKAATRYGEKLSKSGIVYGCAIGVPSGVTDYFVGVISVGFDRELSPQEIEYLKSELFRHSHKIIKH
jgi:hypothetical protein